MSEQPYFGGSIPENYEFSHTVMGPTAGLVLAELGADVVKVEPAPEGDATADAGAPRRLGDLPVVRDRGW